MSDLTERIIKAAAEAMGSDVAVDLDEHRDVAAAVLRVLADDLDSKPLKEMIPAQVIRAVLRDLADEIAPVVSDGE